MDQTIRKILELDATGEQRLQVSELLCEKKRLDAAEQADAFRQAQTHQIRDILTEFEEQIRAESEQKLAEQRQTFDKQADMISKQFEVQHEALLETLFTETLREAER